MLRVWLDHQAVEEFPDDHQHTGEGEELVIFDGHGREVKRYKAGEWHGAGGSCCFVDPDPNCPNCHPASVTISA